MKWYVAKMDSHQGLIIDEADGRNVAVAYDKKDAPLLAAAPTMLEAMKARQKYEHGSDDLTEDEVLDMEQLAIAAAEGNE